MASPLAPPRPGRTSMAFDGGTVEAELCYTPSTDSKGTAEMLEVFTNHRTRTNRAKHDHGGSAFSSANSGRSTLATDHGVSSGSVYSRRSTVTVDGKSEASSTTAVKLARKAGLCTQYRPRVWLLDATCKCGKPKRHPDHVKLQPCAVCGELFSALDNKKPACRQHTGRPVFISDEKHGKKLYAWSCCPKQHGFASSLGEFLQMSLPHDCHR